MFPTIQPMFVQEPQASRQQAPFFQTTPLQVYPQYADPSQFYGSVYGHQVPMNPAMPMMVVPTPVTSPTFSTATDSSSSDSDSWEENKENAGFGQGSLKGKFKTALCRHFQSSGQCPLGPSCHFAHGVQELRPSTSTRRSSPAQYQKPSASFKIELCKSFKNTGSGVCSFGDRCRFVHPGDDLYEYKKRQERHEEEVQILHTQKDSARGNQLLELQLEMAINQKVRRWNRTHPKRAHYHDLHGMTLGGADAYINDIISSMLINRIPTSFVETGKGNHSSGGVSKIKRLIFEKYQGYCGASFVPEENNDGVLVLSVHLM